MTDGDLWARPSDQALVSDQAATRLDPAGFDPSRFAALEDALRSLASYVGAGGYNAEAVDPRLYEDKVRWGIAHLLNATIQRCADVIEEQSKNYARATFGSIKRAILDLKTGDETDAWELQDWRIGQMHAELEHRVTSVKGGELYCDLCKKQIGEDGTLHPPSCPLSYGYDHIRAPRDSRSKPARAETAKTGSVHESGGAQSAIAQNPTGSTS